MQLASAAEMQSLDRAAIEEYRIPGMVLMENAGRGTVDFMVRELGPPAGKLLPVFVGPGNNGGDGLVIARLVHQLGGLPFLLFCAPPDQMQGDAAQNAAGVASLNLPARVIADRNALGDAVEVLRALASSRPVWSVVDALFGTGMKRPLTGNFLEAVRCLNRLREEHGWPVTAVDLPSGLDADTGLPLGDCVRADLTATYGLAKPGHFLQGRWATGRLQVVDIGIPPEAVQRAGLKGTALDSSVLASLLPGRSAASHKGNYGHLLVLAGSAGKTGAAILAARAALRMGTGLVTLGVPADLNPIFETTLVEAMTVPMPCSASCLAVADVDRIAEQLPGKSGVVLGPGLGLHPDTQELVHKLYREVALPMVVDADALNILARQPQLLADPPAARVLTPHPGEMARLTGKNTRAIQEDRLAAALQFTASLNPAEARVTLVLKGAGTLVCDPDGSWAVNTTGNPGMASGGMGDVLSGLLGALLAQGLAPAAAARLGVYLHGLAADRLAGQRRFGYSASEVADLLPYIITEKTAN
ncbi:MAG TPA: bifunctional ADP-dependent NAD(P)H-hydrate dehydratase/NAD(P)H-hydrate epimerase [Desulfobulbaceae bacterium]|nr:bifunctional ADP-dependent NAD(P)H-hydrate dehydratase/NAD(P)H-hydrate epimerase [Desulfobulbaceae bacterium]